MLGQETSRHRRLTLGGVVPLAATHGAPPPAPDEDGRVDAGLGDLLEYLSGAVGSPDIDLDGDGLESVAGGREDFTCHDGCTVRCPSVAPLPSPDPDDPMACADLPEMADGYSVSFVTDLFML